MLSGLKVRMTVSPPSLTIFFLFPVVPRGGARGEEATESEVSSKAPVQKILVFMASPIFDAWEV